MFSLKDQAEAIYFFRTKENIIQVFSDRLNWNYETPTVFVQVQAELVLLIWSTPQF